jgi:hypothetical protein
MPISIFLHNFLQICSRLMFLADSTAATMQINVRELNQLARVHGLSGVGP